MIDEKINKTLTDLEANLMNLKSASEQVKKTVTAYDGLKSSTDEYVKNLGAITTKIQELVNNIGKDYEKKIQLFEEDRKAIFDASTAASKQLYDSTNDFKNSLLTLQNKLKYSLIMNAVSIIAIAAIIYLVLK